MNTSTEIAIKIFDNNTGSHIMLQHDLDIGEYLQIYNSETPDQVVAVLPAQIPQFIKAIQTWHNFHLTRKNGETV